MEEINRLSLLQEIQGDGVVDPDGETDCGNREGEADGVNEMMDEEGVTEGGANDLNGDDGEQNQEVDQLVSAANAKGKEKALDADGTAPLAPFDGDEGAEGGDDEEALDNPAIQEEAALTYEGSKERNAKMEKFYCLLLVEWGECMLNQVLPRSHLLRALCS
jgi:hypothetical protein